MLRWFVKLLAGVFAAGLTVIAGLFVLGLDWPVSVTRHLPPALLGLAETARDRLSAILIEDDWRDCSDTELFLKPSRGAKLEPGRTASEEEDIVIAAVGDVLLHEHLQRQGFTHKDGFGSLWHDVAPILRAADLTYANLEGPVAPRIPRKGGDVKVPPDRYDGAVFTGYPRFNYPPAMLEALRASGVDVVSTANNHSLDRGWRGADSTIHEVIRHGIQYTGTRLSSEPDAGWHTITRTGKWRIAWLACTYGTNGLRDRKSQVLNCFADQPALLGMIEDLSTRKDVDAVILTPHWGRQYVHTPSPRQKALGHAAIEAGATAVLGSHPHVIQPWELHHAKDGRTGLIMYSLGNFVSAQRALPRRSTLILLLGLKENMRGKLELAGARYIPLAVTFAGRAETGAITAHMIDRHRPKHRLNRKHLIDLMAPDYILPPAHPLTTTGSCTQAPLKSS